MIDGSAADLSCEYLHHYVIAPLTRANKRHVVDETIYKTIDQRRRKNVALLYGLPWNEDEDISVAEKDRASLEAGKDNSGTVVTTQSKGKQRNTSHANASSSSNGAASERENGLSLDEIDYNAYFLKTLYNVSRNKWHMSTFTYHVDVLHLAECKLTWRHLKVISGYVRHNGALSELKLNNNQLCVSAQRILFAYLPVSLSNSLFTPF